MAATDAQSLFTQGQCYACYGPLSAFQILKLALLAQISISQNPSNDTSPQALLAQGKCFPCYSNVDIGKLMELALLQQIAS